MQNLTAKQISTRQSAPKALAQVPNTEGEFADFGQWKEVRDAEIVNVPFWAVLAGCSARRCERRVASHTSEQQRRNAPASAVQNGTLAFSASLMLFIDQMVAKHNFNKVELEAILRKVRYVDATIQLMKPAPPGQPKDWRVYQARFVDPIRINAGVDFWSRHADALARAEAQFGVPAEIIVGIIGVETLFGRYTGKFRVLDALTTLAFDYPDTPNRLARMNFFQEELENTLLYAYESGIDPFALLGSYAGAIGLPQFMPSSIRRFAVDFDSDGIIDLSNSPEDAIGSVANFLLQHGWIEGEPIVFPATVSETDNDRWKSFIDQGLEAKFTVDTLNAAGISLKVTPPANLKFGFVDLQNGLDPTEYWLGANNFFAITRYNRSFFYAMSVVDLSHAIRVARESTTPEIHTP